MNDTPTPRVDAQADHAGNFHNLASVVDANLARDLERQLAGATAWRPIETAPQTGEMLVCCNRTPSCDHYKSDIYHAWRDQERPSGWARWPHDFPPTHWQPLPNPPTVAD